MQALASQQVGTGALEVEEEAIEGVIVWLPEHHTRAGLHGAAGKEAAPWFAQLIGAAGRLLAVDFVVEVQAAALNGAVQVVPEDLPSPEELSWGGTSRAELALLSMRACMRLNI